MKFSTKFVAIAIVAALLAVPSFAATAKLNATAGQLIWTPDSTYGQAALQVVGPQGFEFSKTFAAGELPSFVIAGFISEVPTGSYNWSLTVTSEMSDDLRLQMQALRGSGDTRAMEQLKAAAGFQSYALSGHFVYDGQNMIVPNNEVAESQDFSDSDTPTKDQVILDDLIVDGSICAGMDCVNGESFGFDTIRLKENNLRIRAQDTSSTSSFPSRDWQITFNDSSNGGANKFSIDDIDGGRTPFTIEAGAPSHSLYVDDAGRIGFGKNNPVVELHVADGDTPTLRLEQDGSNGFTPQTWDVAGNEANFFVRDATNGSTLPFKIVPGAPSNALYVATDGDVGLGTTSPGAALHVSSTASASNKIKVTANGRAQIELENSAHANGTWRLDVNGDGKFSIIETLSIPSLVAFQMDPSTGDALFAGSGTFVGTVTANPGGTNLTFPDYVFEEGYDLMPLSELATFIAEEGHLPKLPTAADVQEAGGAINMTSLQLQLLEKVEELTLYTLSQQELIQNQNAVIEKMQQRLDALSAD